LTTDRIAHQAPGRGGVAQRSTNSCPICGAVCASYHGLKIHRRMMNHAPENKCLSCGVGLTWSNWKPSERKQYRYYCLECSRRINKVYAHRYNISPKSRRRGRAYVLRLRLAVLSHYSPQLTCQCTLAECWHSGPCTVSDSRVLCIDHVAGGGASHRKTLGQVGRTLYNWIKSRNYPDGFQALCHNCNWVKASVNMEFPRKD
jgi:hypothetical protein